MSLISYLKKIGIWPSFSKAELDQAYDDDVNRSVMEHKVASIKSLSTSRQFHKANSQLKEAVKNLKTSGNNAFSDFERALRDR